MALPILDVLNGQTATLYPIYWSRTAIKRVCRSTLMSETYAMSTGAEQGRRLRAAICGAKEVLDKEKWQDSAPAHTGHVWATD